MEIIIFTLLVLAVYLFMKDIESFLRVLIS